MTTPSGRKVKVEEASGYMAEEHGYIAGRARLYSWKSAVILPESVVILPEEHGYIAGRARLYS
jgi:hypothetical protein